MDKTYAEKFRREIPAFVEMTERFYRQEVSVKDYKGFSGRFGSYAQRGGKRNMLRLRLNCGRITKEQLAFIAGVMDRYRVARVHFTTCQTIQLHDLDGRTAGKIMQEAADFGILTWGCGGDFPRNVMCSPLSGVERGEYFDVLPYALTAGDYLMGFIDRVKLPRKLKVGFSNSPQNQTHATFRDLGFVATKDGRFDVYSAGGVGINPKMGLLVAEGADPTDVLFYVQAMVDTFLSYGNYENRARARTRYMQDTLGQQEYAEAYREKLRAAFEAGNVPEVRTGEDEGATASMRAAARRRDSPEACAIADADASEPETAAGAGDILSDRRVIPQKQAGLYAVAYHPIGGCPPPEKLGELCSTIRDIEGVELRLSPDETLYILNCAEKDVKKVLDSTKDSARNRFEESVACIGAGVCQLGAGDSQKLLRTLTEEMRKYRFADGVLPKIHISGCPSSCGTHQIGTLGFRGGVKLVDKKAQPAFFLHVNGCDVQGKECFGQDWGAILTEDIPAFLAEVGRAVEKKDTTFERWLPEHPEELRAITKKYQNS